MAKRDTKRGRRRIGVMISTVAERFEIHPQTLRMYEREGLITPLRSAGNTRLYDDEAIRRIEVILTLTRELGVNLAGVEVILNMREQMETLNQEMDRLLQVVKQEMIDRRSGIERHRALVRIQGGPLARSRSSEGRSPEGRSSE